jgi:hypothetical protein
MNTVPSQGNPEVTRMLRDEVDARLGDLHPLRIDVPTAFLLGSVDGGAGVQPADLRVVIEVTVRTEETQAFTERLSDAFNVLGERAVPRGRAFALAVPPFSAPPDAPETFTVVMRHRDENGQPMLYPANLEGHDDRSTGLGIRSPAHAHSGTRAFPRASDSVKWTHPGGE